MPSSGSIREYGRSSVIMVFRKGLHLSTAGSILASHRLPVLVRSILNDVIAEKLARKTRMLTKTIQVEADHHSEVTRSTRDHSRGISRRRSGFPERSTPIPIRRVLPRVHSALTNTLQMSGVSKYQRPNL